MPMSDTPQPINRKLRRAGEASQQAYVYHAADSQNPPTPKATHITRSFTPPEPPQPRVSRQARMAAPVPVWTMRPPPP